MKILTDEDKYILRSLGVDAVILFGSYATGTATDSSDYDVGILINSAGRRKRKENYHKYYTAIYDLLAERFGDLQGLDVVFLDQAPLELRRHVLFHGKILMENKQGQVMHFNDQTMLLYADFEPYREMMHQAVLAHI